MKESTISIPANCFNPKSYVKSHPATGLLSTRSGDRLMAIPEILLKIIPKTLREEAGEASYLALYTFGNGWGKTFCGRLVKDIAQYYRQPLLEIFSADFLVYIQEAWAVHGLGKLSIDFSLSEQGLLVATVENSGMGVTDHQTADYRSFSLEAGFLAGWFSSLTGQELRVSAINWSNPQSLQFLVGAIPQIEEIERTYLQNGMLNDYQLRSL
jgi:uncharacterized protein